MSSLSELLSSPTSAYDSSPMQSPAAESVIDGVYQFKTADLRLVERKISVPHRRRTIADFFKTQNIKIVRAPDTTNLAPDRQYIQLKAYSERQLNDTLQLLEELGAKRIESPKRSRLMPPQVQLTPTRIASRPPVLPEIDLRSDEPIQTGLKPGIWTFKTVEKASFVPRTTATAFKPSQPEQEPQQQQQQQVAITPSTSRKASQASSLQDSPFQMDEEGDFVMKDWDLRPRAETIAVEKVVLKVPEDLQSRVERSQSSPPKVAFSVLHKPHTSMWDKTASVDSQSHSGPLIQKPKSVPVRITFPDGTPAVYTVPQRRAEIPTTQVMQPAVAPAPSSEQLQQPSLKPTPKSILRNTPKSRIQTTESGSPTRIDQDQLAAMIGGDLQGFQNYQKYLADMYPGMVPTQVNDEASNTEPQASETVRRVANLPNYPADSQIPHAPRGAAPTQYANVLPRVDQMQKHAPQTYPPHYPQDFRNSLRRQKYPAPYVTEPYQQRPNPQAIVDENKYSHMQSSCIPPLPLQFDPRFGSVRNGRDVRSGTGIPKIRTGRGPQPPKVETEPEDEELELMNNIPYRLRAIPLTGPRFIR